MTSFKLQIRNTPENLDILNTKKDWKIESDMSSSLIDVVFFSKSEALSLQQELNKHLYI